MTNKAFTMEAFDTVRAPIDAIIPMGSVLTLEREDIVVLLSLLTHAGFLVYEFRKSTLSMKNKDIKDYFKRLNDDVERMAMVTIPRGVNSAGRE